jgi:hypothetical protein
MKLKVAILGTRGIPNYYGGFEHISEYVSAGLVKRGHEVTVYNSHNHPYSKSSWNDVEIRHCYDPEYLIGTAGQFVYDLNCLLDARKRKYDAIMLMGYTSTCIPTKVLLLPIWTDWNGKDQNIQSLYRLF